MEPIILASTSPRRQEILRSLSIPFSVMTPAYDEPAISGISPEELTMIHSAKKVESVVNMRLSISVSWVLGADTLVCADDRVFGKPESREDARNMLSAISGRRHRVITSLSLYDSASGTTTSKTSVSSVDFMKLDNDQVDRYLDLGEWQGAAGGYRIQGIASCFVSRIEGSWSGIVGLPIHELYVILREHGYRF